MSRLCFVVIGVLVPIVGFSQQAEQRDTPFTTALVTWLPFLLLVGLWLFFMRRMTGKGGYREYMRVTQERVERIETHLADIASSLRKIAESSEQPNK